MIDSFDAEVSQAARLLRIVRSQNSNAFDRLETAGPSVLQQSKPSRLALAADAFVKGERFRDGVVISRRVRADLFKLPNVVVLFFLRGHQRPQLSDLRLSDVQKAGAVRREQPLMQARSIVVTVQVGVLEREVSECVRAVDDDFDAALASHLADSLDRKYLPGEVGDVTDKDHFGLRSDRALEPLIQIIG